jgi:integrase
MPAAYRYADFHSLRHCFITGLARAGVSPKMAQTLARHSDIRLTLGVYTHVELPGRTAAIESLPAPLKPKVAVVRR